MQTKNRLAFAIAMVLGSPFASALTLTLDNPGFEDGMDGWNETDPASISTDAYSGSKSLKISGSPGRVYQNVDITPNTDYILRAYVKGAGEILVNTGSTVEKTQFDVSTWTNVKLAFNSGSATSTQIAAKYTDDDDVRFDEFAMWTTTTTTPTPTPTPVATPTPTPTPVATPTPTPVDEDDSGVTVPPGNASYPHELMENYDQWKMTFPDGEEEKELYQVSNEYFYVNDAGNGIVFHVPIRSDNGSTANSDYIRSELREREEDGGSDIYWTTDGTHVAYVQQAITHLPIVKNHLVATQIHGNKDDGIDDAMVLRLEDEHLFLSFNGNKLRDDLTIKTNYQLGTVHEVIFEVIDGKHYVYYSEDGGLEQAYINGSASGYLVKDGSNNYVMDLDYDQSYFKVGNYTQSNADEEGSYADDDDNYGEVVVYNFWVNHDD